MDILLVASEFAPWVRHTGVSEVVASFSKTLKQIGHAVTVVVPYHPAYDQAGLLLARRLSKLKVGDGRELTVYDTQLTSGVQLVLVELGASDGSAPDATQATLFAQAVAALVSDRTSLGVHTDIVHVQDWLGSLVALAIDRIEGPHPPTVVTLQNGLNMVGAEAMLSINSLDELGQALHAKPANLTALAVRTSKAVITPSHAQARALVDPMRSGAFANQSQEGSKPILGIPPGIEYGRANPATDPLLPMRFDAEDASQKAACKGALQKQLGLDVDVASPLLMIAGPLTGSTGQVIGELLTRLLDYPVSVVVTVQPGDDTEISNTLNDVTQRWKSRIAALPLSNDQPYTPALAAADFALLGDATSPLCTTHLYALRYGAVPIANLAGYYSDQLIDCDAKLETGNCFAFETWNIADVVGAVSRAISAWSLPSFEKLRHRIMRLDLGWERPTRRTLQVYRQVLGIKV